MNAASALPDRCSRDRGSPPFGCHKAVAAETEGRIAPFLQVKRSGRVPASVLSRTKVSASACRPGGLEPPASAEVVYEDGMQWRAVRVVRPHRGKRLVVAGKPIRVVVLEPDSLRGLQPWG
jgi:hypothetical protein